MTGKTVLILGGGIGGLVTANRLRQHLPHQHRIVLIEKNDRNDFAPSFLWLMTGDRRPEQITRPLRQMVRRGVEVVQAQVRRIDPDKGYVEADGQSLAYDYLVVALGAELVPEAIPGLVEAAHTFYTLEGTLKLRDALKDFTDGTVAVVVSAIPYKCPGAPHEAAMLMSDFFKRRGLGDKVDVHLFTPEPQPMPVAGPALGEAVKQMLTAKRVSFHPKHKLTSVNPQSQKLAFDGKEPFHYDLLAAIPPHRGPQLLREAGLANEAGWVPVDRATLQTKYKNVYALGDVTALPIPGRWKPDVPMMLPKAGVFAHGEAETVARRIADEIGGTVTQAQFDGMGYCWIETGGGSAGFASGEFYAEPDPVVPLPRSGRLWHWGKVLFEQYWLGEGIVREASRLGLNLGSRLFGFSASL
ncbi:MAG: NAD(P)/FAD-dependent oxidoreductase [Anaerolineales bacterium]|nr:NAD(P)/FAD-dependent oxidoreductase [Anaerolineales bacterium]